MPGSGDRKPRSRVKRVALLTTSLVLMLASLALAAVGLVNPGFEDGLSGWNATIQKGVYGLEEPADCPARDANSRYGGIRGVCVVGTDTFTVRDHAYEVVPAEGQKMVRLGGPFQSRDELQPAWERYGVSQTFKVDPQNPVVKVNYNAWTFDYTGFDELRFTATLVNENNEELANFVQGAYGSGTRLKSTGWQTVYLDLTGFENQDVKLAVKSGGTWDSLYGFWSYIDAGVEHEKPVGNPTFSLPDGISGQQFSSGPSGQTWLTVPAAQVGSSCIPLTVRVPIDPGAATLSNVRLVMLEGNKSTLRPMVHEGNNVYSYEIPCIRTMELLVSYRLTEDGASEDFVVPIGGLVLVDPAGVIYDRATFEASKAGGASDEAARAAAAIKGATVRLQRKVNNTFINVLSGDPGIKPKINPQVTGPDGWFAWDTSAGTYRVVVSAPGYQNATSREVTVPPEVLDLHVAMNKTAAPQPIDRDGDGVPDADDQCPDVAGSAPTGCPAGSDNKDNGQGTGNNPGTGSGNNQSGGNPAGDNPGTGAPAGPKTEPCKGLTGTKLAVCRKEQTLMGACRSLKGSKKAACVKRAKAVAKCEAKKGKAKKQCVAKAKKVGKAKAKAKAKKGKK